MPSSTAVSKNSKAARRQAMLLQFAQIAFQGKKFVLYESLLRSAGVKKRYKETHIKLRVSNSQLALRNKRQAEMRSRRSPDSVFGGSSGRPSSRGSMASARSGRAGKRAASKRFGHARRRPRGGASGSSAASAASSRKSASDGGDSAGWDSASLASTHAGRRLSESWSSAAPSELPALAESSRTLGGSRSMRAGGRGGAADAAGGGGGGVAPPRLLTVEEDDDDDVDDEDDIDEEDADGHLGADDVRREGEAGDDSARSDDGHHHAADSARDGDSDAEGAASAHGSARRRSRGSSARRSEASIAASTGGSPLPSLLPPLSPRHDGAGSDTYSAGAFSDAGGDVRLPEPLPELSARSSHSSLALSDTEGYQQAVLERTFRDTFAFVGKTKLEDFFSIFHQLSSWSGATEASPRSRRMGAAVKVRLPSEPVRMLAEEPSAGEAASLDINLNRYSLGDDYGAAVGGSLRHFPISSLRMRGNRLSRRGCAALMRKLNVAHLRVLDLSDNRIGIGGCAALASLLPAAACLTRLNLQGNELPPPALARLRPGLLAAPALTELLLSRNAFSDSGAAILASIVAGAPALRRLYLSWCCLRGAGAVALLQAVGDNNTLTELDISWNAFGSADSSVAALAAALRSNSSLLHLDLSFNDLRQAHIATLAEGLNSNHTLLGLHVDGNQMRVDALGFLQPLRSADGASASSLPPAAAAADGKAAGDSSAASASAPASAAAAAAAAAAADSTAAAAAAALAGSPVPEIDVASLHMQADGSWRKDDSSSVWPGGDTCWLCRRWREVTIRWHPATSPDERTRRLEPRPPSAAPSEGASSTASTTASAAAAAAAAVAAAAASAGGMPAVRMFDEDEIAAAAALASDELDLGDAAAARMAAEAAAAAAEAAALAKRSDVLLHTSVDDWQGYAMEIQPSRLSLQRRMVPPGRLLYFFGVGGEMVEAVDQRSESVQGTPVVKVNVMTVEPREAAWPTDLVAVPRPEVALGGWKAAPTWSVEHSVFARYRQDTKERLAAVAAHDLRYCKLSRFLKEDDVQPVADVLMEYFEDLKNIYRYYSTIMSTGSEIFSVGWNAFTEFLTHCAIPDEEFCQLKDLDTIFIATNRNDLDRGLRNNNPERALVRYEFLEALTRVAVAKLLKTGVVSTPAAATRMLIEDMVLPFAHRYPAQEFRDHVLYSEEVDNVFKKYLEGLQAVYNRQCVRYIGPGELPYLTVDSFIQLCDQAGLMNSFTERECQLAFRVSSETVVDELTKTEHQKMRFPEFLEALARVADIMHLKDPGFRVDVLTADGEESKKADELTPARLSDCLPLVLEAIVWTLRLKRGQASERSRRLSKGAVDLGAEFLKARGKMVSETTRQRQREAAELAATVSGGRASRRGSMVGEAAPRGLFRRPSLRLKSVADSAGTLEALVSPLEAASSATRRGSLSVRRRSSLARLDPALQAALITRTLAAGKRISTVAETADGDSDTDSDSDSDDMFRAADAAAARKEAASAAE